MALALHADDRYTFNPGDHDIATGIPDDANGQLELAGLGHQYMNHSTLNRVIRWWHMDLGPSSGTLTAPPGRARRPQDNRRVRNRV
jgi:hypothetical protein